MMAWSVTKVIADDNAFREAAEMLKIVKGHINNVEEERKKLTRPLDEVKNHLMANAKVMAGPAVDLEKHLKELILAYEEKRRVEEMKAAEARAKAIAKKSPQTAAEIIAHAEIAVVTPEVSGLSMRQIRKARIVDLKALAADVAAGRAPVSCIEANMKFLNAMSKGDPNASAPWAGVEFYNEASVASGSYSK